MAIKPRSGELGTKNIVGAKIVHLRKERKIKQRDLLAQLQVEGMEINTTSLSRLEGQYRHVFDYEVVIMARVLKITIDELLGV